MTKTNLIGQQRDLRSYELKLKTDWTDRETTANILNHYTLSRYHMPGTDLRTDHFV